VKFGVAEGVMTQFVVGPALKVLNESEIDA